MNVGKSVKFDKLLKSLDKWQISLQIATFNLIRQRFYL